ncbi:MAG: insulinase family protein [Saprospiraceae bacterium]|nr:insulinase family protein [Saprospiraceae bacterium]
MNRIFLFFFVFAMAFSCKQAEESYVTKTATDEAGYTYEYVTGDDSKTRIYTLDNGLKVYTSVYKNAPRIQTFIPVKAGGKFDPANSTGLAHYLEHMMFKGTDVFGTKDWEKEKVLVDSIEQMFEHYRTLTDPDERTAWYAKIDAVSKEASQFAIANEYDRMIGLIGAKGTNAYTTDDRTVYMNDIPSNQLENFFKIEANRFGKIVNRLFHTELEAVYEEKNRSLDNDGWKVAEAMPRLLFKKHPYGLQTVIGTIEHLKNPSITDINAYFDKYYRPNNVAICLSGDFDPSEAVKLADQYFGYWEANDLETYNPPVEDPITSVQKDTVWGPNSENVSIGFRMGGTSSKDYHILQLVDYLLANSTAGLIDLNLKQKQAVLEAYCYVNAMNDYSIHNFFGQPREGQSLDEVKQLLLDQIDLLKKGEFEDWLIQAVVNDFKKSKMRSLESNSARANNMVMAFTNEMDWAEYISLIERMEKVTKEELMAFVNEHYRDNYGVVYKLTGDDPNKKKVDKPAITKVDLDRNSKSPFYQSVEDAEVADITPVFVDYENDIVKSEIEPGIPVLYKKNEENQLFNLYYLLDFGTNENPKMKMALDYIQYLGTEQYSAEELKKEFYKLGAEFSVFSSEERLYVTLSGLSENMVTSMQLFEELLNNPKPDEDILKNLISDSHKQRSDVKKNKGAILWGALSAYAKYGENSPFTNVLSNETMDLLESGELLELVKSIPQTQHRILYYGPLGLEELNATLGEHHRVPETLQPAPEKVKFAELDADDPQVFYTDYDMVQAEIIFQSPGDKFDKDIAAESRMFNEYFGGNMSSVVFQEIREAQGLAYSVFASYSQGTKKEANDQIFAYVGTQVDKQVEAMDALLGLLNNMPESEQSFEASKKAILKKIESERVTKTSVLFNYLNAEEKGLTYDIRKDIYSKVKDMSMGDLKAFHEKHVKNKKYNLAIIGDKNRLNLVALGKYGIVQELSLAELFGYDDPKKELMN